MACKDELGDRLKQDYENRTRYYLPRRTCVIIRVDGKSFHSYTRGCMRPYDPELMEDMDLTAKALCEQMTGARLAYVQSDEISILLTDFDSPQTEAWFDNNLQKMCSVSASIATAQFNLLRWKRSQQVERIAYFDSRVFTIPDPWEVYNYFVWRQNDATSNSISMSAHCHLPQDVLEGKSSDEMQEMLWKEKGINWNDFPAGFKRGRCVVLNTMTKDVEYLHKRTGERQIARGVVRRFWEVVDPPVFTKDKKWLLEKIPVYETW